MLTTRRGVRVLGPPDLPAFLELTAQEPAVNVFAEHRARLTRLEPRWLGGEVWGRYADNHLVAACHVGANLVPVEASAEDAAVFADRTEARDRRSVSTIVGVQDQVSAFWEVAKVAWPRPRETRWRQPHLVTATRPTLAPDPLVRRSVRGDLDVLYPACVAMYTEEVGVSPERGTVGDMYRVRVHQLITRGWSFVRIEQGRVVFKAEVACATPSAAQIQGVWVDPARRGEGIAAAGMAAVVTQVLADIAPVVSLYVNDWNVRARRTYTRCGFTETARFGTIMF